MASRRQREDIPAAAHGGPDSTATTHNHQQHAANMMMFDLAAPSVEDPLVATLVPQPPQQQQQQQKFRVSRIELRAPAAAADSHRDKVVGRSLELQFPFRIECPRLSNEHAVFRVLPASSSSSSSSSRIAVIDTSTNGVWVNGERLKKNDDPHPLAHGDVVSLLKPNTDVVSFSFTVEMDAVAAEDNTSAMPTAETVAAIARAASMKKTSSQQQQSGGGATMSDAQQDEFLSEITCSICMGVYYKPACVMPCLHTFCGPCVRSFVAEHLRLFPNSDGSDGSNPVRCPDCRAVLTGYSANHKVQALIQQVVAISPGCVRPQDEIVMLEEEAVKAEERAKAAGVTSFDLSGNDGSGKKKKKHHHHNEWSDEDDDEDCDDDDGSDDEDGGGGGGGAWGGLGQGFLGAIPQAVRDFMPLHFAFQQQPQACASCRAPDARDGFQCPPGGNHLVCRYCKQIFPDRPACGVAQRCGFCATPFCDLYCGPCKNASGVGILKKVEDHVLDSLPMGTLFRGNYVEQQIFKSYLQDHNIAVADVWRECLSKFRAGEWTLDLTPGMAQVVTAATPMCKPCVERVFAALLVHYRIAVPRDQWPPAVGARPDCWYGLECRTQHNNPSHAQRYNHICIPRKAKE